MSSHWSKLAFGIILASFLGLAWAYGLVLPPFENLDEIEHFAAIRYVAETGALPRHDPALQEEYHYRQEASQPPLYYLLMGGVTRLLSLSTQDANSYLIPNRFVACGPSDNPYNKHVLYHNPVRERWPWNGALLTLHVLRAVTPLLQLVTLVTIGLIARLIFPRFAAVAPLAMAVTAFNPQFLLVSSGVNNDNLVTPLATVGLYLALLTRQRGWSLPRTLALGLVAGLAGLSKLSGLLLLVLIGLVFLEQLWRIYAAGRSAPGGQASDPKRRMFHLFAHGLLIIVVAAAVSGWWFGRNYRLYGDVTALTPMLEWVGRRTVSVFPLDQAHLMFRSYWGQLSCAFFSDRFYLFFTLLTGAGVVGLLWGAARAEQSKRLRVLFLASWFGIILVGWIRWDLITPAPGGRLLFPATAAVSVLLACGLLRWWPTSWRAGVATILVGLLGVMAGVTLGYELHPLFALPRTFAAKDAPVPAQPLEATFGPVFSDSPDEAPPIRLLGYEAAIQGIRPHLDVTLYWQAQQAMSQDYALTIQLTSPVPGDDSLRFNYNTWPGRGNYPTSAWMPGRVIADHYRFPLPPGDDPTQAWQLLVAFYDPEHGERLPVRRDSQDLGKGLILTTLRVPGRPTNCPETELSDPVDYQNIWLQAVDIRPAAGDSPPADFEVALCWESRGAVAQDYTVFVHLYDEQGELVTTGDGPPLNGAFPTHLWRPGDLVRDTHHLPVAGLDLSPGAGYRIGIGLYEPTSGVRVPAVQDGNPLPNDTLLLDVTLSPDSPGLSTSRSRVSQPTALTAGRVRLE
jgi:hypothetical protein